MTIICSGGWEKISWDLWSFSLESPWSSSLLIGYSDSGTKPATVIKVTSPTIGQIPLLKTSCPNPNSFLLSRSDCCCCFSQCTTLPHHWRLCTTSSLKHLSALAESWASPSVWHTLYLMADGVTKSTPFGDLPRSQNRKYIGCNSTGQVPRMTDVLSWGAPW